MPKVHYLNADYGIKSWLLTTDHKRIALLYLGAVTFFFLIGGIFATMIRIHLLTPGGYLVSPTAIEFFTLGADRVHERIRHDRIGSTWTESRLAP